MTSIADEIFELKLKLKELQKQQLDEKERFKLNQIKKREELSQKIQKILEEKNILPNIKMPSIFKSRKDPSLQSEVSDECIDKLTKIFTEMTSRHDKPLAPLTLKSYVAKLNRTCILMTNECFNGSFDFLLEPSKVIKAIAESNLSSKKDYLSPIVRVLKAMNATADIIAEYQKGMSEFKKEESDGRKKNEATPKEKEMYMSYNEIKKHIERFKVKDDMDLVYLTICSLYFMNTLVPRNDLNICKLVSNKKKAKDLNKDFNFIVLDASGTPVKMIWQRYKSDNTFGQQQFDITPFCRDVLKRYMTEFNRKNGDYLFVMRDGESPFKKDNFRDLIKEATKKILGKAMSVNLIRTIQITNYFDGKAKSIEEDEADARRYLHSLNIHKEYFRLDLNREDDD